MKSGGKSPKPPVEAQKEKGLGLSIKLKQTTQTPERVLCYMSNLASLSVHAQ